MQKSIKRLGCQVTVVGMEVNLVRGEKTVCSQEKKAVRQFLNDARDAAQLEHLLQATDQGRSFHLASQHPNSNHWIREGSFVSFANYRFAIKGRLNLLPTKVVIKRAGKSHLDTTCPKCKQEAQTLGHVLNACTPSAGLMRERHNTILQRLVKAIPESEGDRYLEQKVKNAPGDLRPDLVLWHGDGKVSIIDVTIPYEGDRESFEKARREKKAKYQPIIEEWLRRNGKTDVLVDAFIVGSLGSWDTANDKVLKRLRIGLKYANLFRKLCTIDAIKGSLAV